MHTKHPKGHDVVIGGLCADNATNIQDNQTVNEVRGLDRTLIQLS